MALYNEGKGLREIAQELGNGRDAIGVRAKLAIVQHQRRLTRPLEEEGDDFPFLFRLVSKAERLIDLSKELQAAGPEQARERAQCVRAKINETLELLSEQQ